ncbi:acyl-coenzyme A diphosphatase FITM2-like [Octopus vulgaris]|uniref:Acyl-coenzyme A diphosphatase FITM2-like n=1 Tax=Octopus vulgaris TaxID=6645 RepID=A0AA36AR42_OCTVU|nr:acyl-coenzyme A diphosphatase FITM2-like [Octopus vulgaris]
MAVPKGESLSSQIQSRKPPKKLPTQRKASNTSGKMPVLAQPIHVGHFLLMVVMKLCRKVLLMDISVKIGIYVVGVFVASVIADLFVVPPMYFSRRDNLLNLFFVNFGWIWTVLMLSAFISLTSYVYTGCNVNLVKKHLLRLAIATFWWYVCTTAFDHMAQRTGICTEIKLTTRHKCKEAGRVWLAFDVSGHVFLLTHNLLTIVEECRVFKDWKRLRELLQNPDVQQMRKVSSEEVNLSKDANEKLTPYIKAAVIMLTFFTLVWEFMLLITSVYRFHSLAEKVAASMVSVICWFISYRIIYPNYSHTIPYPGQTPFRYMT